MSVAARCLEEGIAEARAHGKSILCILANDIVPQEQLAAVLDKCVPRASLRRKVEEVCCWRDLPGHFHGSHIHDNSESQGSR